MDDAEADTERVEGAPPKINWRRVWGEYDAVYPRWGLTAGQRRKIAALVNAELRRKP